MRGMGASVFNLGLDIIFFSLYGKASDNLLLSWEITFYFGNCGSRRSCESVPKLYYHSMD